MRPTIRLPRAFLIAAAVLLAALLPAPALARGAEAPARDPKLSAHISGLAEAAHPEAGTIGPLAVRPDIQAMLDAGLMRVDGSGRLQVYVHASGDVRRAAAAVRAAGGETEALSAAEGIAQARVALEVVTRLAADARVRYVGLPSYGFVQAGQYTSEGVGLLNVEALREEFGVGGRGVRVGVISNGIRGYQRAQETADLPETVDITTCNVAGFDPTIFGAEGTALMEIVHDVAPEAELWFGNFAFSTHILFMEAVSCLARNVDAIVDDVSFFNLGPYDGTSAVSAHTSAQLNDPENRVRAFVTSVGNFGERHYEEPFFACAGGNRHEFKATALTLDPGELGPRCGDPIVLGAYAGVLAFLQWNDPRGASCNDYDVKLLRAGTEEVLASGADAQACAQDPVEALAWLNPSLEPATVELVVEKAAGAEPRDIEIFFVNATPGFYTSAGSVPNQSDAGGGVISTGSISVLDEGFDEIASYSSRGPTNDGRQKPQITAADCVLVSGAGGFPPRFCGTSAAAPHVAGIAALLLDCYSALLAGEPGEDPAAERAALYQAIISGAVDRGEPGPDNVYGAGLADARASGDGFCLDPPGLLGDADCSGAVDAVDSLWALRYVAGLPPPADCIDFADADCDGDIDATDSLRLLRYVSGAPLPQPPGCRPVAA